MGLDLLPLQPTAQQERAVRLQSYTSSKSSLADKLIASLAAPYKDSLDSSLKGCKFSFVLTDPWLPDNPIVYASDGFLHMSGYSKEEVLGRNCRFLQGPATDRRAVVEIRDAIHEERSCQVTILNYTKDREPLWNLFHMVPLYSKDDGGVVHFVGVQTPISIPAASSANPHSQSSQGAECKRIEASGLSLSIGTMDSSSQKSNEDKHSVIDLGLTKQEHRGQVDVEDVCQQPYMEKAKLSVKTLLQELMSKCKGAGLTETRCTRVSSGPGGERVIRSSLMLSLTKVQQSFVLANPHLPDIPIVHASDMFLQLTGYRREEVIGRNCKFLQGPGTDQCAIQLMRESLNAERPCTVKLLNYRKDQTPFWNLLYIAPVRSAGGKVALYVGVQLDVTAAHEEASSSEGLAPDMKQLGAVGAIKVAVRSLQGEGLRRVLEGTSGWHS